MREILIEVSARALERVRTEGIRVNRGAGAVAREHNPGPVGIIEVDLRSSMSRVALGMLHLLLSRLDHTSSPLGLPCRSARPFKPFRA